MSDKDTVSGKIKGKQGRNTILNGPIELSSASGMTE